MKKIFTLFISFCFCYNSYGKTVTESAAKAIGYNYLVQKGASLSAASDLNLIYTEGAAPAYFYVFGTSKSFVIVAAEDGVTPILGYSKDNGFGTGTLPKNITGFLNGYNRQIKYVIDNKVAAPDEIAATWYNLANGINTTNTSRTTKTTDVSPLLSTTWDQYPNYNALCPSDAGAADFGGTDVTGCVATAMAQVMKYWNWPTTGIGFNSYSTSSYGTLSANFGATTYDWTSMPNSVTSANAAVATLMYHAGVSVNMQYTATESGAYVIEAESPITNCAEYALKTYFNYVSTLHGIARSSYTDADWISTLEAELTAGRPTICSGDGTAGGHCFVFDGFESSGNMFHVNWGWSGASDGYYTVDALNPPALGTGGGAGGFNSDQAAIIGITPDTTLVAASGMSLASNVSDTSSSIYYGQAFYVQAKIYNAGTTAFSGSYAAMVFDTSGALIDSVQVVAGSLAAGATSGIITFTTSGILAMLPGTYTVAIYDRAAGSSWSLVNNAGPYNNATTITVVNHNFIELYSAMTTTPASFVQGSAATVSLILGNASGADYADSIDLALYNLDGSGACEIETLPDIAINAGYTSGTLTFSTSDITVAPGTYLMAVQFHYSDGNYYLAGTDFGYENPTYVTVVAPALSPDIYEVNNTAATAYNLPLTFTSNVAAKSTTGSNFHVVTDQDYYKVELAAGYNYKITARVNDDVSSDDAVTYTTDAIWSYSTDGGTTWSSTYDDVMPGTINVNGGGTVIFHCVPHYAGNTGTYILKLSNITRTAVSSITSINLDAVKVFPVPAADIVNVDISGTNAHATTAALTDLTGKRLYEASAVNQTVIKLPVSNLAAGVYFVEITTEEGPIKEKISVSK